MKIKALIITTLFTLATSLLANEVEIVKVKANCDTNRVCAFDVTLKHEDTGWKHFANKWEIYTPNDKLIATRTLFHPHVQEQPFTRSLSSVKIPKGINKVIIKAHDSVHGYAKKVFVYDLEFK
jgi:hypothetical protein